MPDFDEPLDGAEAAEQAETAQAAVDNALTDEEVLGWDGKPFEIDRFKTAFERLRDERNQAREAADQWKRIQSDEDARTEWLRSQGYEVDSDEPDTDDDEALDEPVDPRVEAHEQWIRSQQEQQALKDFSEDLDSAAAEAEVKLTARDRKTILAESMANGFNPEATRKALKELVEDREQLRASWQEEVSTSKKTSRPPGSGKTATQVPDLDNDQERRAWMAERLRALNES